ncbi:MAG: alcohol dehydrogenase [Janthinobacterium lividum]
MKAWAVVAHNAPLQCVELPDPEPVGTEIVVEVTHCGVCHSDLHLWKGGYDLGGGRMLSVKDRGLVLPAAPGHEIVGRVARLGPDASGVAIGDVRLVYPWVGCGQCAHCRAEEDNYCTGQRSLGVSVSGGFGSLVKVPHARYLIPFDGIDPALAATYACSGLTAYAAVQKIMPLDPVETVALIGAGGLGLAAVAVLRALGHSAILVVDPSAERRAAALEMGASLAVDGSGTDVAARIMAAAHPTAVLDFVGSDATAATAMAVLPKGGKLILVGIGGGELTLSVAGTIFRAQTVQGSLTGSIPELRAVIGLARDGNLPPIPIRTLPKDQANAAIDALEEGRVTGRIVLVENAP